MTMTARALIIDPDGSGEVRNIATDLVALQAIVDGYLECVTLSGGCHVYINEEGKIRQMPVNQVATDLAHKLGWPQGDVLCGPAIFLGSDNAGGEVNVPQSVLSAWQPISTPGKSQVDVMLDPGFDLHDRITGQAVADAAGVKISEAIASGAARADDLPACVDLRNHHFGKGLTSLVNDKPPCAIHKAVGDEIVTAEYDGKTQMGPWAYMCLECFERVGTGLGTGKGQKLILRQVKVDADG